MANTRGLRLSVVTELYRRLNLTAHTGTVIKQRLLDKGLIGQEKIRVPNGSVTLLKITKEGRDLLASWGIQVRTLPKNASLEHEYWKRLVAEQYRAKGYKVEEEFPIGNGKAVDLVATKDGKRIALEIETGKSDANENVRKCKEADVDNVIVGPRTLPPDLTCKSADKSQSIRIGMLGTDSGPGNRSSDNSPQRNLTGTNRCESRTLNPSTVSRCNLQKRIRQVFS